MFSICFVFVLKVMKEVGFQGTFEEFLQFLRSDQRFYFDKKVRVNHLSIN